MIQHSCRSVLLIEDDPDSAEALMAVLELQGIAASWVQDGEAALQVLQSLRLSAPHPDLILLDLLLPGTDTIALGRELRAMCPVILISASSSAALERASEEIGAVAALRKPFATTDLMAAIEEHTPRASRAQA